MSGLCKLKKKNDLREMLTIFLKENISLNRNLTVQKRTQNTPALKTIDQNLFIGDGVH